jgi:dTDP-4-amino-4,6-dideoxygalactose transaminase
MKRDGGVAPGPWRVPLSDVRLPAEAIAAAKEVLESGWLTSGPRVEAFERAFAAYVGCGHAVACSSGTAALQLAYACLGVGPGDEVVLPSLNFVAAANAARLAGACPVFADVLGEDDLTLDPDSVARSIGPPTKAVVLMHYGGHPCSAELVSLGRERGVAVVEDAAHAPGAAGALGSCGSWGDAGCFSFFANKNLPLGEGGMLTTSDGELAAAARRLRSHGATATTWERYRGVAGGYDVPTPGFNMKLDEARAAMGTVMLGDLDRAIELRGRVVERYRTLLSGLDDVSMPFASRPESERAAHHLAAVVLPEGTDRDRVAEEMKARGIQTSVHYPPVHRLTAYAGERVHLDQTDALAPRLITLPLYPHLEASRVEEVVAALEAALETA